MNWLVMAERLRLGQKQRVDCDACGEGNTGVINHEQNYYSFFCFRCGETHVEEKGQQTLADLKRVEELNAQAEEELTLELPADCTGDIPLAGRLWLYTAGITQTEWNKYKIVYSKKWERVIIPVYDDTGKLIWYQARAVLKGQKPKYLQPSYGREKILFKAGDTRDDVKRLVVTEDMLSAIVVGRVLPARSLLGTKITTEQAVILGRATRVTMWLDNDWAGINGSRKIRKSLSLITDVDDVRTDKDPKCYSSQEIEEVLCLKT